ncbi:hypothetical protein [Phenylobacterium sp.]|uniref:hypothetical protein n=1 Tax=Phenylobacterium sp. TaxID=1871053 RepID=UPI00286C3F4F|nr:hypothetical protein [Phenylobacterium sp.]
MTRVLGGLLLAMSLVISACATTARNSTPPPEPAGSAQKREAYANASARAEAMERQGRLREAVWWWQVAEAVAPNPQSVRAETARLVGEIAGRAERLVSEGDAARAKRATAKASAAYQQALALDPKSKRARDALREMEASAVLSAIGRFSGGPAAPKTDGRGGPD